MVTRPHIAHPAPTPSESDCPQARGAIDMLDISQAFLNHGEPLPVLDHVNLSAAPGSFVSLVGPSGSGKSTLLRLAAGLDRPLTGRVYVDGRRVRRPDPSRGLVFQDPTLLPWLTVGQNIGLGPQVQGRADDPEQRRRVDEMIDLVGLQEFRDALPSELSGGMAQRTSLARALVTRPEILLLDEPLGKLDALTRSSLQTEIARLWEHQGFTALMVTHDVEEALLLSDRVVVFSPRPARVLEDVAVDLPRPRTQDDPRFRELRRHILELLA